jgi:hypothetical protein
MQPCNENDLSVQKYKDEAQHIVYWESKVQNSLNTL